MNRHVFALATGLGLMLSLPATAQFQKPEDAIKYRKAAYSVMGTHFARIGAVVQGRVPFDAKAVADNADIVITLAPLPFTAFGEGTDKGDTRAKPEIWSKAGEFKASATKATETLIALNAAAKTGDLDKIKVAFGEAGKTCKGCHDNFRKE